MAAAAAAAATAATAIEEKTMRVRFPLDANSYELLNEIGSGVSAIVYKAVCMPLGSAVVAIKSIDLERSRASLDDVRREAKAMALLSHPNILRAHCSFTVGTHLWVVMPFMSAGSLHSIISSSFPDGLPEPSIAIFLRETLSALAYLHAQGHVHRDIKAGNILVDYDGSVKLADFGVSASIYESSQHSWPSISSSISFLNEVAGTPYWMAPEVIHSHVGYGFKADIWSFGITALELAHGRPPLSHLPLSKSMVMRVTSRFRLEDSHDKKNNKKKKKFSKAFREMVASCLAQDPSKRPSAEKLLRHPFFKNCKSSEYLVKNVLQVVPAVEERFKEGMSSSSSRSPSSPSSPAVKIRRISGWNFNEEVLELDPVYPSEKEDKHNYDEAREHGEVDELNKDDEASKITTNDGQDLRPKDACESHARSWVVPKELLIPNLVSLLSSLDVQREMVMNVLAWCGSVGGDEEKKFGEQREQQLLGLVHRLQQAVDDLNVQLQQELRRNACLEAELENIKTGCGKGEHEY